VFDLLRGLSAPTGARRVLKKDIFGPVDGAFQEGFNALGQVAYHFQQLEEVLGWAVCFLIDPADQSAARIVVCEQSFKQLLNLADSLFRLFPESKEMKNLESWSSILRLASDAENHRNQILHSVFGVSGLGQPVFIRSKATAKRGKGFRSASEELNSKNMQDYLALVGRARLQIEVFMSETFPAWNLGQWKPKGTP
jgi:hypothetical protein